MVRATVVGATVVGATVVRATVVRATVGDTVGDEVFTNPVTMHKTQKMPPRGVVAMQREA